MLKRETKLVDFHTKTWMKGQFTPSESNHHDGATATNHLEVWHLKQSKAVMDSHLSCLKNLRRHRPQLQGSANPYIKKLKYHRIYERICIVAHALEISVFLSAISQDYETSYGYLNGPRGRVGHSHFTIPICQRKMKSQKERQPCGHFVLQCFPTFVLKQIE